MNHSRTLGIAVLAFALSASACGDDPVVDPDPEFPLQFERVTFDVAFPTFITAVPGATGEFLIAEHGGTVHHVRITGDSALTLGTFEVPDVVQRGDCGLLSVTFDPSWLENRYVFATHCSTDLSSRVVRLRFDGAAYEGVTESATLILDVAAVVDITTRNAFVHSIGNPLFEADGTMVVAIGDKASEDGQDLSNLAASLLRIIPSREEGVEGYTIPAGNEVPGALPEVYAYGLRNAWRIAHDSMGRVWAADVGAGMTEEVNLVTSAGQNYGWMICEGVCSMSQPEITDPLLFWDHEDERHPYFMEDAESEPTARRSAWVAESPLGLPDLYDGLLQDTTLFGDLCLGWVRGARANAAGDVVSDVNLGHLPHVVSWAFNSDGVGYVLTFGSCDADMELEPAGLWRATLAQ